MQGECLKDDEGHRKETSEVTVKTFIKIDPGIKLKLWPKNCNSEKYIILELLKTWSQPKNVLFQNEVVNFF